MTNKSNNSSNLKIAIDGGPLKSGDNVRGIGFYVKELTEHLKNIDVIDIAKADLSKYDVVHLTSFNPYRLCIPFKKPQHTKFILTIYDLIPLVYPDHYPSGVRGKVIFLINKYLIGKNIDLIITISETSKKDICRFLGVKPDKVKVTYLANRPVYKKLQIGKWSKDIKNRYKLPKRFALYVGDINYNKNLPNLIKACELVKTPLVIAGKEAKEIEKLNLNHPELRHLIKVSWENVIRLGFVPDSDLVKIYNLASVYVQASFYEGFGLPALEAIFCGTPLAVAKTQCLVEILGDEFNYFDPKDFRDIANSILKPNVNKNLPRVYSWQKTAEETSKLYGFDFS